MRWLFVTAFILSTALTFLSKKKLFTLNWIWLFRQSSVFRIQQSKQLLEDSASDDYGRSSSSSEQKRKKRKRRKNESISLPSQMRVRTQNDGAWLVQHSLLKNQTLWPKMRGPVEEGGVGEEQERRPEEGAVEAQVLPCLPGRMWVVCCQVLALATPDFRLESFSPCAPPCWSLWVPTP